MKTQGQSADGWMKKVATHAMKGETSSLSSPRGWWSTFPLQQCRHVPTQGEQAALSRPRDRAVSGSQRRGFQVAVAIPGCWGSEICGGLARLLSEAHDCKTDNGVKLTCIISKCTLQMMWAISMHKYWSTDHQDLLTVTMHNDFLDVLEPGAGVPTPNQM